MATKVLWRPSQPRLQPGLQLTRGLVGCWPLTANTIKAGLALDLSGNGNVGTLVGAPAFVPGRSGPSTALGFNGSTQWITYSCPSFCYTYSALTYLFWVYLATNSQSSVFLTDGGAANGSTGFSIGVGNGTVGPSAPGNHLLVPVWGSAWQDTLVNIGTGWHRIAVTLSGGKPNGAYIDGVLVSSLGSGMNTPTSASFGVGQGSAGETMLGNLLGLEIYNRVLSAIEIRRDFANPQPILGRTRPRRVALYLVTGTTYTVSFSASQAAGYGLQRSGARSFAFGQSESAVLARIVARAFAAPSGNSTALIRNAGRLLSASAGESAFISLAAARRIALSAPQAAAISYARRLARLFVLGAPSPATMTRGPNRLSGAGQPEASGLVRDPARQLTTGAPSAAGLVRGPQRSLSASVTSAATVFALKVHLVVFACAQGTAFALSRTVARAFGAAAATNSVGRWLVGRILGASQPGAAGARRAVNRIYTAAQSETAQGTFARAITVSAQQSSTSSVGRVAARSFAFAQGTVGGFFRRIGRLLGWIQPSPASVTFPHSPIPNRVVILPPDSRWLESPSDSRWARLPED